MHHLHDQVSALIRDVARDIMMPRFRKLASEEVSEKTPGDYVTIVDRESEARIAEALARITPEARVFGEEAASLDAGTLDGIGEGAAWIIDPLDGTNNFTEGKSPFAIMIGLAIDGEREAGWIYDPVIDRMCHAVRGGGCFVDAQRIMPQTAGCGLPKAAIATYFMPEDRQADVKARAAGKLEIVNIPRCAGEQYPRLFLRQNDIALFERTHPWDHAAGALMLEETGGKIARHDGTAYRLAVPGHGAVAAATPELYDLAMEVLFS